MSTTRRERGLAAWMSAAIAGGLIACAPALAWAQTGISEADVIQSEEDRDQDTSEDPSVANERDALTNRPIITITRPEVPTDADAAKKTQSGTFADGKLKARLNVLTKMITRDNLDFRERVEASRQDVIDTDDRLTYGANQARAGLIYEPADNVKFDVGVGHNGLWGGDSLRNLNNSNTLFVDVLYFTWTPIQTDAFELSARLGRQYFEIGGALTFNNQRRDYFFWDVVDGLTIDADMHKAGKIRLLGLDMVGLQYRPDEIDFVARQETESSALNLRGDTATFRFGGIYENTELLDGLEFRAFGFYADIGAGALGDSTGADLCYGGELCNFPDNDYNWMGGSRVGYFLGEGGDPFRVGVYAEYARSGGIDRKDQRVGLFDVTAAGNAFGGGAQGALDIGSLVIDAGGHFFRADGPQYTENSGMMFNYGFVGFKGAQIGGVAMDDNAGWHPTPYIGSAEGVEAYPQDQRRKSGTQAIHASVGVGLINTFRAELGWWNMRDTGMTRIPEGQFQEVARDLPFGYSQEDIYAQQRLGKSLGNEFNLGLTYLASDVIKIFGQGATFLPGEYYAQEISRAGGTALGSPNPQPFWVVTGGVSLEVR